MKKKIKILNKIKKIIYKNCNHLKVYSNTIYNDGHNIYIFQECSRCKKRRLLWQNKYFYPAIEVYDWKKVE